MMAASTAAGLAVGAFGNDYIDDTDVHTVDHDYQQTSGGGTTYHQGFRYWAILEAITDTVFNDITYHADNPGDVFDTSDTLTEGKKIRAWVTSIDLTSGSIKAHRV
jgi:hypothetical protein